MGISIFERFKKKTGDAAEKVSVKEITENDMWQIAEEIYVRELAFWAVVDRIAAAVSKCEFKTYMDHKPTRSLEYYLWNVEPNKNQNSSTFLQKLISKLYRDNECLVIEANGQILVADSYQKKKYALYDYVFTQVTVEEFTFEKAFLQSDVLYWELNDKNMRTLINGLYNSYKALIAYGMKSYGKSRGNRGILNVSAIAEGKENFQATYEKMMNERFKNFFGAENAVLPLFEGYEYEDIGSKTYSNEGTRDIRAMIDDVTDFTARAFSFPPALAKGDVQDTSKAIDELLTFCIDPLADKLQEEINRKRNGYEGYLKGNYLKIDTTAIKHIDLFDVATAIDKIISSGAFCVNDVRRALGEEEIEEEWANQHFMTKNYSTIQDLLDSFQGKGGEMNGK